MPQPLGDPVDLDGEAGRHSRAGVSVDVRAQALGDGAVLRFGQDLGAVGHETFGRPVGLELSGTLAAPVEVRWDVGDLSEEQRASIVPLKWDEDLEVWAVDTTDAQMEIVGDELVMVASGFSWRSWSWAADFGQLVGEQTGSRRDGPSCDGDLPSWVTNTVDPGAGTSAAAIQVCFEPDDDDRVTVRVVNNRPFTQRLDMSEGGQSWAWTWGGDDSFDVSAAVNVAARAVFDSPTTHLLPPLSETAVGIAQPQGGGSHFISATASVDATTFLVDGVDNLLGQVTPGGFDSELLNEFVALVYECGGGAALSGADFGRLSTEIVEVMVSCIVEVTTSDSGYGARFDAYRVEMMASASPERQAQLVKENRSLHQLANAARVLEGGKLAFYFTDQLQNAYIGNLTLSISGNGRPGELGDWTAVCDDLSTDSNQLFRNLTLREPFNDNTRELWEFDELEPAAQQAIQPLANCTDDYLAELAALLPNDWADQRAAEIVAGEAQRLVEDTSDGSSTAACDPAELYAAWREGQTAPFDASIYDITCDSGWARGEVYDEAGGYAGSAAWREVNGRWELVGSGMSISSICDQLSATNAPSWTRYDCGEFATPDDNPPDDAAGGAGSSIPGFTLPSGNIGCVDLELWRDSPGLECQINSGLVPPPTGVCDGDWARLLLPSTGPAEALCVGDSILGRNTTTILDYGQSFERHGIRCNSSEDGLSCTNGDGYGFELARSRWTRISP